MKFREMSFLNKSDRIALVVLAVLVAATVGVLAFCDSLFGEGETTPMASADSTASTAAGQAADGSGAAFAGQTSDPSAPGDGAHPSSTSGAETEGQGTLTFFDPNTADSVQLLRLGLRPFVVHNICSYRRGGGVFSRPTDLARIYGLTQGEYFRLKPYVRISSAFLPARDLPEAYAPQPSERRGARLRSDSVAAGGSMKMREGETLELNTADTAALKRVPGIGSAYARAIVSYRSRLGGFVRTEQLLEVGGVPESALHFITVDTAGVKTLDINRLSIERLRAHPYLNFYQARDIVEYRRLHGAIRSLSDLRLLPSFTPEQLQRVAPYFAF